MIATLLHQAGGRRGTEGEMRCDRECMNWKEGDIHVFNKYKS
jgi:hypothetical protein